MSGLLIWACVAIVYLVGAAITYAVSLSLIPDLTRENASDWDEPALGLSDIILILTVLWLIPGIIVLGGRALNRAATGITRKPKHKMPNAKTWHDDMRGGRHGHT